ncbi:hypothetical protein [Burkholderia sp. Ax-1719]|uniref:hypothetical protein n=1 Tax=Burkholderia sp. Ax-1719 TaxID=2608334 RepID=UPI00141E01D0|nr:hypothetical protein [Burkholderia sp. Ax-1719]NIE63219.1 hypothetical protein [Burkholderia sp. Ax-1719]
MKVHPTQFDSFYSDQPNVAIRDTGIASESGCRKEEADRLIRSAMDYVLELIRVNGGRWSFYRNVDASLLERWLTEDHPNLHRCVIRAGVYDAFKEKILEYCGKLSAATELAEMYLKKYFWSLHFALIKPFRLDEKGREMRYEPRNVDTERYFPGVASYIESRGVGHIEELPTMVALLVDRVLRINNASRHNNAHIALHSKLSEYCNEWCDLERVKGTHVGAAFLMHRVQFSGELFNLTPEKYAFVVRMPVGTSVDSLIQGAGATTYVDGQEDEAGCYIALSRAKVAIPIHNKDVLLKFRNSLPVVFLLDEEMVLVEYEWNPTAFGSDLIATAGNPASPARDCNFGGCCETATDKTEDTMVLVDVRAMPVLPGASACFTADYSEPTWDDSIPF